MVEPLIWTPADRFARLAARCDDVVANAGFREAMHQILPFLVREVCHRGVEHIPREGPLLIVSNHPGTYDSLAIAASLPRDDLQIVAAGFHTLRNLPHASRHLIFVDRQLPANVSAVRSAIRHLRSGGALLMFPGRLEPDPVLLPGATEALRTWSRSVQLLLDSVPGIRALVTIVSGVISPAFLHSPVTRLGTETHNRLAIAEVTQVIAQMLFPNWVRVRPRISFGIPKTVDELGRDGDTLLQSVIAEAGRLLADHIHCFSPGGIDHHDADS
jgi:hypothetical protein